MTWRNILLTGAAVAAITVTSPAAHAQYERTLGGIRLNSSSKTVLLKYGNPDEVVVGTVGIRIPPSGGRGGGPGGLPGGGGGYPGAGGGGGYPGGGGVPGGFDDGEPGVGGNKGGSLPGFGGGGVGAALDGGGGGFPGGGGGYPGAGGGGGYPGAGGGGFGGGGGLGGGGGVGRTVSTLSRQQEVTWIYNRSAKNKNGETQIVSYEFLISPNGTVSQIRVVGYTGGNSRTQRGLALGSTYQTMISRYGVHEDLAQARPGLLVASYRNKAHVQFQLLADRNPNTAAPRGYKVIGITIATIE